MSWAPETPACSSNRSYSTSCCCFTITGPCRAIRAITCSCVICCWVASKPYSQLIGQLPVDCLTLGPVFDCMGVDYARLIIIKTGSVWKPMLTEAYARVFVSFIVKEVHLEPILDLTKDTFLDILRRFTGWHDKLSVIWNHHGTNITGASWELGVILTPQPSTYTSFSG